MATIDPKWELLAVTESPFLRPGVLRGEVNRILASDQVRKFVSGFLHQWPQMESRDFFQFNPRLHLQFDNNVNRAAREDVDEPLREVIQADQPVAGLLSWDRVVINDLLADYDVFPAPSAGGFGKVRVPQGVPRGGLLGMAAVLAMG